MQWLGVDVGGANLKVAHTGGYAASQPFALWSRRTELTAALVDLLAMAPPWNALAVTMTGELADCYESKAEGVCDISQAVTAAAAGRPVAIYGVDGRFRSPADVHEQPHLAAASNWHALARWAAAWLPEGTGLVVDVGSTTADLIPVKAGQVATTSCTDTERLVRGELVYTGVSRTPVAAVVRRLPYRGTMCPVAAEVFSTTADVYHVLEQAGDTESSTADGRPLTIEMCIARLARQICADRQTFDHDDAVAASAAVRDAQLADLSDAVYRVADRQQVAELAVVASGSGELLARAMAERHPRLGRLTSLSQVVGSNQSGAAAACAVAYLAQHETYRREPNGN